MTEHFQSFWKVLLDRAGNGILRTLEQHPSSWHYEPLKRGFHVVWEVGWFLKYPFTSGTSGISFMTSGDCLSWLTGVVPVHTCCTSGEPRKHACLKQCCPREHAPVMETVCFCDVLYGRHQPQVPTKLLRCGSWDCGTEFCILFHFNQIVTCG